MIDASRITTAALRQVNRIVEPVARTGVASLLPVGPALVMLETVGRRSRMVRAVPTLALRLGNRVFVGTIRGNSHWLANVDATPAAAVWLGGRRRTGQAIVHRERFIDVASIAMKPAGQTSKATASSSRRSRRKV